MRDGAAAAVAGGGVGEAAAEPGDRRAPAPAHSGPFTAGRAIDFGVWREV